MTRKNNNLRVISPDDTPEPQKILSLEEAIETGDHLTILLAQRREMVAALKDTKGPALAALHRQISLTSKEIAAMQSNGADESEGGANVEDEEFDAEAI